MTNTRHIPDKASSQFCIIRNWMHKKLPDRGFFVLAVTIILLSAFGSTNLSTRLQLLTIGEIAKTDILADSSFLFEDTAATEAKKTQIKQLQPLVCDLIEAPIERMHTTITQLFIDVNKALTPEEKELLRHTLSQTYQTEVPTEAINALSAPEVQEAISKNVITPLLVKLKEGVLPDIRMALPYKDGGLSVQNIMNEDESLYRDPLSVPDLKSIEASISQSIRAIPVSSAAKKFLSQVISQHLNPTLSPNYEATRSKALALEASVEPIMQRVQKGEIIVRQGEKVKKEQQLKLQTLIKKKDEWFNSSQFFGIAICGLLLASGLLFSPSGRPVSGMRRSDYYFISTLIVAFSLMAKGLFTLGLRLAEASPTFTPESLAYAVPVAGAAAIASLVFSTRRYLVTGLLLGFFCTIMSNGGLGLFLYYFLGAMWSTWLTVRTQSRQDMVFTIVPLAVGLYALWLGATLLQGGSHVRYLAEAFAVAGGAFISLTLTFALAPIIELVFGYTTRFKLMELLNLEQPLLRDLMLNAPGTYHHSLIISNMVEAAAKAVGAQSLLCKVGALYHDIGKVSKANYFIENQFQEDNPHERLTPSMSALILISHVKQGTELALEHKLGEEITSIIAQHHGTSVIRYFYQKALSQQDAAPPKIEDFSYPGPKPQSREAALVMLADIVEASSRTLTDPTPTRLSMHIDKMIKSVYSEGQLDETELTFRDLDLVAHSFQRVLRGIFHHRISYPDKNNGTHSGNGIKLALKGVTIK